MLFLVLVLFFPSAQVCGDCESVYAFDILFDVHKCVVFVCFDVCSVCCECTIRWRHILGLVLLELCMMRVMYLPCLGEERAWV